MPILGEGTTSLPREMTPKKIPPPKKIFFCFFKTKIKIGQIIILLFLSRSKKNGLLPQMPLEASMLNINTEINEKNLFYQLPFKRKKRPQNTIK